MIFYDNPYICVTNKFIYNVHYNRNNRIFTLNIRQLTSMRRTYGRRCNPLAFMILYYNDPGIGQGCIDTDDYVILGVRSDLTAG